MPQHDDELSYRQNPREDRSAIYPNSTGNTAIVTREEGTYGIISPDVENIPPGTRIQFSSYHSQRRIGSIYSSDHRDSYVVIQRGYDYSNMTPEQLEGLRRQQEMEIKHADAICAMFFGGLGIAFFASVLFFVGAVLYLVANK